MFHEASSFGNKLCSWDMRSLDSKSHIFDGSNCTENSCFDCTDELNINQTTAPSSSCMPSSIPSSMPSSMPSSIPIHNSFQSSTPSSFTTLGLSQKFGIAFGSINFVLGPIFIYYKLKR